MKEWLLRDKFTLGLIIGLIVPLPVAIVFAVILHILQVNFGILPWTRLNDLLLLGVGFNVIIMRYYMKGLKYINTAKGLIVVSLAIVLLFFLFLKNLDLVFSF